MSVKHLDPVDWLLSDDVGSSSRTIFCHFLGKPQTYPSIPYDRGDFGRCVRLLESPFAAGWRERIVEMNKYARWHLLWPHWHLLEELHYAGKSALLTKTIEHLLAERKL